MINVTREDARDYTAWLSGETGHAYRLPSEAEWEYAARAGADTPFHFGGTINTDQANYSGDRTYGDGPMGVYRGQTVTVGSYPSNRFGLHDVHGNVSEWVEDCWNESYAGAPSDTNVWMAGECYERVRRGGSWFSYPGAVRSATRTGISFAKQEFDTGFRVAMTLP